jgi:hypothetical protein
MASEDLAGRVAKALDLASAHGAVDGGHHKMWCIDQMVRALTGCPMVPRSAIDANGVHYTYRTQGESREYLEWVIACTEGEDGPETYEWDQGIAP